MTGLLLTLLVLLLSCGCATTSPPPRIVSQALDAGDGSLVGQVGVALMAATSTSGAGDSSLVPLADGQDALAARLMLVEQAERSLDLQYYIFRPDESGQALLAALRRAADRGVRVRLLLDDWGTKPDAATLRALAAHPHIEVRLFNPLSYGGSVLGSLLFDFDRTQRRMHNKLLVADGRAVVLGGRNIGDEYFARHPGITFSDLDVLAVGAVVRQSADGFDRFWNEAPVALVDGNHGTVSIAGVGHASAAASSVRDGAAGPIASWRRFHARLLSGELPRYRAQAQAVQDLPNKAEARPAGDVRNLGHEIAAVVGQVQSELLLVSPYFVPGSGGVAQLGALRRRGVRVVVVTNSLAATDVSAVHAGYARHRAALLQAGVELHELRADSAPRQRAGGRIGSSRVSLHAKLMVVDGAQLFIGSMNIDPRSLHLNSENGLVIHSPLLAGAVKSGLEGTLADTTWRVTLQGGQLVWQGQRDGVQTTLHDEPAAGLWLRLQTTVLSWLPIEGLL